MTHKYLLALSLSALFLAPNLRAQLEPQPGERAIEQVPTQPVLVEPPSLSKKVDPIFPEEEKAAGQSGQVVLRLTVDEKGQLDRAEVVSSASRYFDWAALGAATNLEFSPALFAMQPVEGEPLPLCPEISDLVQPDCAQIFRSPVQLDYAMNFALSVAPVPPPPKPKPPTGRIAGIIREAGSKRPLVGVEVVIEMRSKVDEAFSEEDLQALSALTDADGQFFIENIPTGDADLRLALSGYEPATEQERFSADEELQAIYYLVRRSYSKFTTVVRAKKPPKEVTKVALRREEVDKVPGTFGDPLRVIENLPGLARAGAIGGALLVRGANPSDSLVLFDSVEIPILYHFGGLTSVINAEFLENINFYPGGFGARYGRATAGIVDVDSRELDMDSFRGSAELDLLDSGFFFAGPVDIGEAIGLAPAAPGPSPQRITFAAAARRSYVDALLPFLIEAVVPSDQAVLTASPVYWDYQTKIEYRPHQDHRFSLMAFGSNDNLRILARGKAQEVEQDFNLAVHQSFHRIVGRYQAQLGSKWNNNLSVFGGITGVDLGADANQSATGKFVVNSNNLGLRDELTFKPFDLVEMDFGLDLAWNDYTLDFAIPLGITTGGYPRIQPNLDANTAISEASDFLTPAFYIQTRLGPFAGLTLLPSYRFDGYYFGDGEERYSVEPRLTARWQVARSTTLKAAFGIYEQLAQPQELSDKFGSPGLDLPRAMHYIVGYEHKLTETLNLSLELYFNDKDRQVVSGNSATVNDGNLDIEFYNNNGIGRSYGAELMLRHELSRDFFGWIAYTLSRSENRAIDPHLIPASIVDQVNNNWVLNNYDQTHILTVVAQYKPTFGDLPNFFYRLAGSTAPDWLSKGWRLAAKDWSIGGRFRLVTGNPSTPILFAEHDVDTDDWSALSGAANSSREPMFQQLDLRVDRKVVFENFVLSFYLDLLNAYNAANVEALINDYRYNKQVPLTGLPIIPVIGMQGEF